MKKLDLYVLLLAGIILLKIPAFAQENEDFPFEILSLENLAAFQSTSANWKIVGKVYASLDKKHHIETKPGTGILVNEPDDKNKAQLFSQLEHGDIDLRFEFMMPKGSNSGVYLQGRYEIQLLDSWGKARPSFGDLGGIYQRWDDTQPEGSEGFEGIAPMVNVAKAPGLWQTMHISFQAPRFDAAGNKTQHARIIFIKLNGIVIHRNVELTGPTRGNYVEGEGPTGPLVIQGDHGPVAFRNIAYRSFSGQPVAIKDLRYQVVRQPRGEFEDWENVSVDARGEEELITWEVVKTANNFSLRYQGTLDVPQTGKYIFRFNSGGQGALRMDGTEIFPPNYWLREKVVTLSEGEHSFELEYTKSANWVQGRLGLEIGGENFRPTALNYAASNVMSAPTDPIFVKTEIGARHHRSFVDFKMPHMEATQRITHAINIGDPTQIHYTYDLNQGSLVQAWRGKFLDVSPMWNNRGNGVSIPRGSVLALTPNPQLMKQQTSGTLQASFAEGAYQYTSYQVDEQNRPTFHYSAYGVQVSDQILPQEDRKGIQRRLTFSGSPSEQVVYCLAEGVEIEKVEKGLYAIGDGQFFVQTQHDVTLQSFADNRQALVFSIKGASELAYQIIW